MKSKWLSFALHLLMVCPLAAQDKNSVTTPANHTVKATLNGSEFVFDPDTGSLLKLSHPVAGVLLDATRARASLIDLAYPVKEFEVLRAAARYSRGANVKPSSDAVEIHWDKLGLSRTNFSVEGKVSATVRLTAAPDGRSIIFTARVNNQSKNNVRQILFPDLMGLVPVGGAENTFFRTSLNASRPFIDLAPNEDKLSTQYMLDSAAFSIEYQSGGLFSSMGLRWMDFGGLKGGLSLFAKRWGWDAPMTVRLHLSEVEDKLRLLVRHDLTLAPGEKWESDEFWLTPHANGWGKGIEPYRQWASQKYKRVFPLPQHVRDGIGFRTVWMCQIYQNDPQDVIFKSKDLPALAKESLAHGLDEMVIWAVIPPFERPLPPPYPHLGTEQEFYDAIKTCRQLGVNASPFISVVQATTANAPRYGLAVSGNNGWTYHTELVPRWNPPYASALACVGIPTSNQLWQEEVLASCKKLVDQGVTSLGWDQYWTTTPAEPNMQSLTVKIREYARKHDPQATFCAEELWNFEIDSGYLDYTWNWGGYRNCAPLTSVLPTPRVNACVSQSPLSVKKSFADNLYLNIMPRRKESANASDWIRNYPEMSVALKQCAALKKQFLPHFTEGTFIGDGILSEPCPGAHVAAYVRPKQALVVVINEGAPRKLELSCELSPWLGEAPKRTVKCFNADGRLISEKKISHSLWRGQTPKLRTGEMAVFELSDEM